MAQGFADPYSGLASGLSQGVNLGLQVDQAKQIRKQREWQNDFQMISTAFSLANSKGMSKASSAKILNGVAPLWNKYNPNAPFPELTPQTVTTFKPVVENISKLGQQASSGKMPWSAAFQEASAQVSQYHTNSATDMEMSDREKQAIETVLAPLKAGAEAERKQNTESATFVATTPDGQGVYFNPRQKNFGAAPLPGGGPLRPKTQEAPAGAGPVKMLPPNTVLALNEGKNVARMLPEVETALMENRDIFGPLVGRAGQANPYNTKAQTVDALMRTASQSFGKFMEGGVLRKEDEEKYRKMFPRTSDTPKVAENKLSMVRRMLAQRYEDDRKTLGASNYDVSGFESLDTPPSLFGGTEAASQAVAFNSIEEAESASLPAGTVVTIGGRRAVVE